MFIYNFKLNTTTIVKIIFAIVSIILIIFFIFSAYKIFNKSFNNSINVTDTISPPEIADIKTQNYTNVLKVVHENLDTYIGQNIHFTGYVYRVTDLTNEQFVLARDMIVNPSNQTLVVGFLCNYKKALEFSDKTWIEITGTIEKGNYHGKIPVINIKEIKKIDKPTDEYVYPPNDTYIQTSILF